MIKILFLTSKITGGGAERMLINIINSLSHMSDYKLKLIVTSYESIPNELSTDVEVLNLNLSRTYKSLSIIIKELKGFKPNYVFTTSSNILYLILLGKLVSKVNVKLFVRVPVTPSEMIKIGLKGKFNYCLNAMTYKFADKVIVQTEKMKNDVSLKYKVDNSKIQVIRNIIDTEYLNQSVVDAEYKFDKLNFNIVASGALYSVKGFDILIEAFQLVVKEIPNARLYILGKERYEKNYRYLLESLVSELNLTGYVCFLGHQNNPYPYYKSADLFVLSSRFEGFPNVVLEALHFNTPVVATDCVDFSGIIIDGVNGYVFSRNSVSEMSKTIIKSHQTLKKPLSLPIIKNFDYSEIFV